MTPSRVAEASAANLFANTTIFALATPPGRSAVAIIRVSGQHTAEIIKAIAGSVPAPREATLRTLREPVSRQVLDRALVLWLPGPRSYTGEDQAEFHLHGGRAVVAAVMCALTQLGAELAKPGEFSRRAFENDKLDLVEAEAVADLVDAESEAQRRQAMAQLQGALGAKHDFWRSKLVDAAALVEAAIDFPDDDLPDQLLVKARAPLAELSAELRRALSDVRGQAVRDGYRVAIVGAPNAGKSSLMNALARRDVAIVSDAPGTTRDIIEVFIDIAGYRVVLADTAGIRETQHPIEAEGVRRATAWAEAAETRMLVVDQSGTTGAWRDPSVLFRPGDILVLNKSDVRRGEDAHTAECAAIERQATVVSCRADTGDVGAVREALVEKVTGDLSGADFPATTRVRHRALLERALGYIERAKWASDPELAGEDIRLASRTLRSLTGRVDSEDILDRVFASFCIGK